MDFFELIYFTIGIAVSAVLLAFVVSSMREQKLRAILLSLAALLLFVAVWALGYELTGPLHWPLLVPVLAVLMPGLLFFLPIGPKETLCVRASDERFDERDVIFAREEYQPGTAKYETYYKMRPEKQAIDDRIRHLPELLAPGGRLYDPKLSAQIDQLFEQLETLTTEVDGGSAPQVKSMTAADATNMVKTETLRLGAGSVGIATMDQRYVYSHVGRGPEPWGEPIENDHSFAIAFTVEMEYDMVETAPQLAITEETANRYLEAAKISIELANQIRKLGYRARAHIAGSNYQIIMPAVAYQAGLGELSRMGYLITPEFGPRVRLGAVTTNLPLIPDQPREFGVQDFCSKCKRCAVNCPSAAIPDGDRRWVRGVHKWQLNIERCLSYWRGVGSDCGICMRVCPYSHPGSLAHTLVRAGIFRSAFARTISVYGEDLLYGRKLRL
jgi:formate hydrogenlyase subunit 6/NADH:ubiquinone oxidoreductase subunit I